MRYDDASGSFSTATGATPDARDDLDALAAGDMGPATGNAITGSGTVTGASGADLVANPPATVIAVEGAGGAVSGAGEVLVVEGQFGTLTMSGDGSYSYARHSGSPDGVQDVFTYTLADAGGARDTATLTIDIGRDVTGQTALQQQLIPGADGAIVLPEGVQLSDISVSGRDLVILLPDGSTMVIPDGAVFIPQLVLGDVEVPAANLAALLIGSEPQPAAGPPLSGGGNFSVAVGPLDPGVPLGDLIPPTQLGYTPPTFNDLGQFIKLDPPTIIIETPESPGATNAIATVFEAGLPARPGEAPGSNEAANSEFTSGTIEFTAPSGFSSVTINGVTVAVGAVITTPFGILTITSFTPGKVGTIGFTYQLTDNTSGDSTSDQFTMVVFDTRGESATATLTVNIVDDVPTARNDSATQQTENAAVTVNVFANDTPGADSVNLASGVALVPGSLSGAGTLVYNGNGTFTYTPAAGEEGTVTFQYRITDGDGDVSTATVTITLLPDSVPTISIAGGNSVNEAGLPARPGEAPGSNESANSETTTGTITVSTGGDTLASLVINGVNVTGGGTVVGAHGVLTVTLIGGVYHYSYTLTDNTLGDNTSDVFSVVATDSDGDVTSANLTINIIDDVPTARDDVVTQAVENAPVTINVMTNDTPGADSVNLATGVALVAGSLTGAGTLVYNGDGTFTYTPAPGEEGVVTFQYRITDGDGDTSIATVTITLLADSVPTIDIAGGNSVNEAGLPARTGEAPGSDEAADSETTTGTITVSTGGDTLASLVINGVNVTGGGIVVGAHGTLTVTLIGGVYHYSYTLTDNTLGDDTSDVFNVVATDSDGDVTSANLTINIIDDVPTARDDVVTQAVEDVPVTINVMTNDTQGADSVNLATGVALVPGSLTGAGNLVYNGDGTFTYTQAPGEEGTITFQYQITDGDGDTSIATVTIHLQPDSTPTILIAQGSQTVVYEEGLPIGSNPQSDGEFASGTLVITTGNDTIGKLIINGVDVTNGGTVNGLYGVLTITGSPTTGYTYVYQLTTVTFDGPGDEIDSFAITVVDSDGDEASVSLDITIVDDVPTANDDSATQESENAPVTINVIANDVAGADGVNLATGVALVAGTLTGTGTLLYNGDGTFTYTPGSGEEGTITFQYQITDGDGDVSIATVTITLLADSKPIVTNVTALVDDDGLPGGNPGGIGDETGQGPDETTYSGTLVANFGSDTPGTFSLAAMHGTSGMVGTEMVSYSWNAATGVLTATGPRGVLFTVQLDAATGDFTVTLVDNVLHAPGNNENNATAVIIFTATDSDGDSTNGSLTITFNDDTPTVAAGGIIPTLTVDESNLAVNASASFAAVFSVAFGADGAAAANALVYTLGISANGALTGLIDTATGHAVQLVMNGNVVEGRTVGSDHLVFTVSVDASGNVTLDQIRALSHPNANNPNDPVTLSAANLITLTATATDGDGDSASATANIGQSLVFLDDGPSISATGTEPTLTVDESNLAVNASASFAGVFTTAFGADGAGSITYALGINAGSTGLIDVATGEAVVLVNNGGVIEGRTATTNELVFTVSVNAAGTVTLDQIRALSHPNASNPDDSVTLAADNLITLTATITDKDGDSASATIGLGQNLVFKDDGPSISASGSVPTLTVDESNLAVNASASFAGAFNTAFGADGAGTITYAVSASANGASSGLIDVATGQTIFLFMNGSVLEGRVGGSGGPVAFTVSVSAAGVVTLDQIRAIQHPNASNPDDAVSPTGSSILLTATITDKDGDSASQSIAIGSSLVFKDDGPSISASGSLPTLTVDESNLAVDASASFAGVFSSTFGADGAGTITYVLGINAGATGLIDVATGNAVVLSVVGGQVVGTAGVGGPVVFTVSVAANGTVTLDQIRALQHADPNNHNESVTLAAANLVTLTATITDKDGDSATATANIGQNLVFLDDGPSISVTGTIPTLTVDETNLAGDSSASFAGVFTAAFGADGAAAANSLTYALSLSASGANSGLIDSATGNSVFLFLEGGNVVGRAGTNAGTAAAGPVVFVVSVAANGTVTLDQQRAILHDPNSGPDQSATLSAANLIKLTATAVDRDGDSASATANIGQNLVFKDDAPTVTASGTEATLTVDETNLAINATQSFATAFNVNFGADGAAAANALVYTLGINAGATGLVDTATGHAVQLVMNGGVVEGRTIGSNHLVFTVSVDASGNVTLDQMRAVMHLPNTGPNQAVTLSADNLVTLTATATDKDGDSSSATIGIGQNLVFLDDAPTLGTIQSGTANNNPASAVTTGALNFSVGADAPGSVTGITLNTAGLTSGGKAIFTSYSNGVLTAYADADGSGGVSVGDTVVFTLTVNPSAGSSGQYVFDLFAPLDGTIVNTPIGGSSSFGAGPTAAQILTTTGGTAQLAVVSGYNVTAGFNVDSWKGGADISGQLTLNSVNGSTSGWGIGNNNFNNGQMFVWDFGPGALRDPDGGGAYNPPPGVSLPNVSFVTFDFINFSSSAVIHVLVRYTDDTFDVLQVPSGNVTGLWTYTAPAGKFIDEIEMYAESVGGGGGKVDLVSVGAQSTTVNINLNFTVTLADADGDSVSGSFGIHLADGNSPSTAASSAELMLGQEANFLGSDSGEQLKQASNTNSILFGAIAAAGLSSMAAAESGGSTDDGRPTLAMDSPAPSDADVLSDVGSASIVEEPVATVQGWVEEPVLDNSAAFDSSQPALDSIEGTSAAPTEPQPLELTDSPAPTESDIAPAPAVAMPSAEMLAGDSVTGDAKTDEVERVLVDALDGGGSTNIDGLLSALPGGNETSLPGIASPIGGDVSHWDAGALGPFAGAGDPLNFGGMEHHADAVPNA